MDDPQDKAKLSRRQLAHFQPQGDHAQVAADVPPYGRMLSGIRGLRLHITGVAAKAARQRRRRHEIGEWKPAANAARVGRV